MTVGRGVAGRLGRLQPRAGGLVASGQLGRPSLA